jgi:catechol 2,3-dioxygenase-like lactoylglutathione lyase family enzyme
MKLEHANLTVSSIEKAVHFLTTVFPEFRVRAEGEGSEGQKRWMHLGTDSTYLALEEMKQHPISPPRQAYFHLGINHLCFEVENIEEIHGRLLAAGYPAGPTTKEKFRKRFYVGDNLGNEWEFVQYFSNIPSEKNLCE